MRKDEGFLLDMLLAARLIARFVEGATWESFRRDEMLQSAVRYQARIIGESAGSVGVEFRRAHSEVPWDRFIALRHRLVHGYREVELERVWRAAVKDVRRLVQVLERLVPEDGSGGG